MHEAQTIKKSSYMDMQQESLRNEKDIKSFCMGREPFYNEKEVK